MTIESPYIEYLKDWIDLQDIPFTERGSRLLVFRRGDSLSFRLAERWFKREHQLASYRTRVPIIDEWVFTDADGSPLTLAVTSYPDRLEIETAVGLFKVVFVDQETLLFILPRVPCGIRFLANMDQAHIDRRGGVLRLTGDIRRNVAYTTNAKLISNEVTASGKDAQSILVKIDGGDDNRLLLNITPRLGFNRYLPDTAETLQKAAGRWHDWFAAAPQVQEKYKQQYYFAWWIMRAGLISTRFYTTREAMTPSKMFYVGVWQWDAYFHALAYRYTDPCLARDQLRILLDHQREDGMIPDAVHDEGVVTHLDFPIDEDVTKPPLIAWAAWKMFQMDGDKEFLNEVYESIVRSNRWWYDLNDRDGNGLCEYGHPYSSGLDDSPLWDEGMPVEAPDLNTYLFLQQEALSKIATIIGEDQDAILWKQRADNTIQRMLRYMWDDEAGLFWARHNEKPIRVRTPFSLFPLMTGHIPADIAERLVAHLTDEKQFWPRYPVPTVALDDPHYEPDTMWRGPTWINVNYMLIEGLYRSGYPEIGKELRTRTLDLIAGQKDIFEFYNSTTGHKPPKAAAIFGWSSAIFIDLVIQEAQEAKLPGSVTELQ